MGIEWNEVLTTGKAKDGMPRAWAVATALEGWGNCISDKEELPENFGKGMADLTSKYDIPSLPEELSTLADNLTPSDYKDYSQVQNMVTIPYDELVQETDLSWQVIIDGDFYWLPKSQCDIVLEDMEIAIPKWLANSKGIY